MSSSPLLSPAETPASQSTLSSSPESSNDLREKEASPASLRLQAYASLKIQPPLSAKMSNLLSIWVRHQDPAEYDWEAEQRADTQTENLFAKPTYGPQTHIRVEPPSLTDVPERSNEWKISEDPQYPKAKASDAAGRMGDMEDNPNAEQRERAVLRLKRQRQASANAFSQPTPKKSRDRQQQVQEVLGSSQTVNNLTTASQPEPGRYGGSRPQSDRKQHKLTFRARKAGF